MASVLFFVYALSDRNICGQKKYFGLFCAKKIMFFDVNFFLLGKIIFSDFLKIFFVNIV